MANYFITFLKIIFTLLVLVWSPCSSSNMASLSGCSYTPFVSYGITTMYEDDNGYIVLNYTCLPGLRLVGKSTARCNNGDWNIAMAPICAFNAAYERATAEAPTPYGLLENMDLDKPRTIYEYYNDKDVENGLEYYESVGYISIFLGEYMNIHSLEISASNRKKYKESYAEFDFTFYDFEIYNNKTALLLCKYGKLSLERIPAAYPKDNWDTVVMTYLCNPDTKVNLLAIKPKAVPGLFIQEIRIYIYPSVDFPRTWCPKYESGKIKADLVLSNRCVYLMLDPRYHVKSEEAPKICTIYKMKLFWLNKFATYAQRYKFKVFEGRRKNEMYWFDPNSRHDDICNSLLSIENYKRLPGKLSWCNDKQYTACSKDLGFCLTPGIGLNMKASNFNGRKMYLYNETVTYTCRDGFNHYGSNPKLVCTSEGWQPNSYPECVLDGTL